MRVTTFHSPFQVTVKREIIAGLVNPKILWRFHWRFWEPLSVIGGTVRFGWYAEVSWDE